MEVTDPQDYERTAGTVDFEVSDEESFPSEQRQRHSAWRTCRPCHFEKDHWSVCSFTSYMEVLTILQGHRERQS